MWEVYLKGVGRLYTGCGEADWRVWESCQEDVGKLSRGYGKDV